MSDLSAVVFVPDDTAKTGFSRPMMLQAIMGTPLLSWLTRSLAAGGVGRFFLVCHERFLSEAKHCFPDGCELSCAKLEETADQLHVFLSTADEQEEDVIVVTGPAVIDPFAVDEEAFSGAPVESGVSSVSRQALMDALDDTFIFTDFMKEHGIPYTDRDGVYAVSSMQQLAEWKPVLSRGVLYDLAAAGVSIWDYDNTYVEPTVFVGAGAELLPGTVLRGTTSIADGCMIGPNSYLENVKVGENTRVNASQVYDSEIGADTTVGPFAYVRPGSRIGSHVRCGDFVEVKNSTIGDGTKISHLTYIGDSDVGKYCNFGCGTVTCNYDGKDKFRTTIGDYCFIGCNTNLVAPVKVGDGAYTAAGSTITQDVPAQALGIARERQTNLEGWAEPKMEAYIAKKQKLEADQNK